MVVHWKENLRNKECKHVPREMMQKRKDVTESSNQQDVAQNEAKIELRETNDNWKEHMDERK